MTHTRLRPSFSFLSMLSGKNLAVLAKLPSARVEVNP